MAASSLNPNHRRYLAKLANCYGLRTQEINILMAQLAELEQLDTISLKQLSLILKPKKAEKLYRYWHDLSIEEFEAKLRQHQIWYVTIYDREYPSTLKDGRSALYVLFGKGSKDVLNLISVALVGSRKPTSYGERVCQTMTELLVANNVLIVSGLAMGIDTIAHQTTLNNHGITIAVLAHGLDTIQPSINTRLAQKIIDNGGALISEYGIGVPGLRQHFPARNRIIAGLSRVTIVVEGSSTSGSLITAEFATKLGKPVLAVPGQIYSQMAQGPNMLIHQGANILYRPEAVFDHLPSRQKLEQNFASTPAPQSLDRKEFEMLTHLKQQAYTIDELADLLGLEIPLTNHHITILELHGLIVVKSGLVQLSK